jgi:hypothetical protein
MMCACSDVLAGDRAQAHRPGSEHGDHGDGDVGDRGPAHQSGVDATGRRLDHHGSLVAQVVRNRVDLRGVCLEVRAPAATCRVAEAGLDTRVERGESEVGVIVAVAGRCTRKGQREAPCRVAEDRLDDHAGAVLQLADHLVAGRERERDEVVEVGRRMTLDCRQIAPADTAEPRLDDMPTLAEQLWWIE